MPKPYAVFLEEKAQWGEDAGFDPTWMPDFLFEFQRVLVEWAIRKGRAGIFADCGLGKTPMQLVWAENVHRETGKPVLILTPLAVSYQTETEAEKFGIEAGISRDGSIVAPITVTNYERLQHFDRAAFGGVVCDESSALKSFDGVRRQMVTEFMRKLPYRLLCTATAAPNDYIELGTSSEALGELGYMDMLARFFKNDQNTSSPMRQQSGWKPNMERVKWRLKGHAEEPFWRWVSSWARAIRRPSDLGFDDDGFNLPPLEHREHLVEAQVLPEGRLFDLPAIGLREEREEQRRTIQERCEQVAAAVEDADLAVTWCQLNDEGNMLAKIIPDAVQVSGSDALDAKEEKLAAFSRGEIRVLVTKPVIGAWGLNWQHCHRMTFFPSHSYEHYYQAVRRSWRFGQMNPVMIDIITTEGSAQALSNLQRKGAQADRMFDALVAYMNEAQRIRRAEEFDIETEVPAWLS